MDKRLKRIADHYGYEVQSRQLIEEMAELTQALTKLWKAEHGYLKEYFVCFGESATIGLCNSEVLEKIAYIELCIEQVKYLFGIDERKLRDYKRKEIERQLEIIEHEGE